MDVGSRAKEGPHRMRHQYTPIFRDLLTSSLWASATPSQRCVWITLLLLADPEGYVPASVPGLALAANVTVDEARAAVAMLEAPDPDSRTPDFDGRRIEKVDHGWRIINFVAWRKRCVAEAEKARKRAYMQKRRAKPANDNAEPFPDVDAHSLHVADRGESGETIDAPKPIPKPKPSSPEGEGSPLPPGVFDAPSEPLRIHELPEDWQPSDELRTAALTAGLTAAEFDQRVAEVRLIRIGGQGGIRADRIDEWIANQLGRWKTWAEANRLKAQRAAQAPPGRAFGGGYGATPQLEPNDAHRRFAAHYGLDLESMVRTLTEQRCAEKLGAIGAREELERRLKKAAAEAGHAPKPKRAVV